MRRKIITMFIALSLSINVLTGCNETHMEDTIYRANDSVDIVNTGIISSNTEKKDEYYFYQLTSEKYKENYIKIYQSLLNKEHEVVIECKDLDEVEKLIRCIRLDHPEIFYIENSYYIECTPEGIVISWEYSMNIDEIEKAQKEIDQYLQNVSDYINKNKYITDYEKEKAIYDYMSLHTYFDTKADYDQSMYSVIKGKAVCMGYSLMFKYLCNQFDINCIVITGSGSEELHAWNTVLIDEDWYMVDCSAGNNSYFKEDDISYNYFNITREQMLRSASIDNLAAVPECTSIKYEYYNVNNRYFDKVDLERYKELVYSTIESGENTVTIRCLNDSIYTEMLDSINEVLLSIYETNVSFEIYSSNKHLLIKIEYKQ